MTSAEVITWRIVEAVWHSSSWLFRRRCWGRVAAGIRQRRSRLKRERRSGCDAAAIVSTLKARPGSPLAAGVADRDSTRLPGGLKPRFAAATVAAEPAPARVTLPANAAAAPAPRRRGDRRRRRRVAERRARAVARNRRTATSSTPARCAAGATVLHRALPRGPRTSSHSTRSRRRREIAYDLALGEGAARPAAGRRHAGGAGRGRRAAAARAPPYIVGADGAPTDATLAVDGLRGRHQPGRAVGAGRDRAGRAALPVKVSWPGSGVAYPAILDPRWTTTGSMATARQDHTMTLLATGKVLVTGGRSTTGTTGARRPRSSTTGRPARGPRRRT